MPLYRKKPVIIEAVQWHKQGDVPQVATHCSVNLHEGQKCKHCEKYFYEQGYTHGWIRTLEGGHIVCPGDFIITGVIGEQYPCKPNVFEQTYEAL